MSGLERLEVVTVPRPIRGAFHVQQPFERTDPDGPPADLDLNRIGGERREVGNLR
jgi:hypothetical protein